MSFVEFFLLTFTFGPVVAVPYGLTFIDPGLLFLILLTCYTLPVPAILYLLNKFEEKEDYKNRIINEAVFLTKKQIFDLRKISDEVSRTFIDWWGDLGYDLALAFLSFVLGFLWGAFIGFVMRLPRKRAFIAIFFGNFFGLIFWFAVAIGTIEIFDPTFFVVMMLFLSAYSYIYARMRERRILPLIVHKVEKELKEIKKSRNRVYKKHRK